VSVSTRPLRWRPGVVTALIGALILVSGLVIGGLLWRDALFAITQTPGANGPDLQGDYPLSAPLATPGADDGYPSALPLGTSVTSENQDLVADDHGTSHEEHDENMLSLSPSAEKNLGITSVVIKKQNYEVTESVPGFVVERPGQTYLKVPAPTTGVVTEVVAVPGEAVRPGQQLFTLRLTHEVLVDAQTELLQTVEQLDVVAQEIARLGTVGEGVIARKQVLEQQYDQQKLLATQRAQKQRLALLGFDENQIAQIVEKRRLLSTMSVKAPDLTDQPDGAVPYHLHSLNVQQGESVTIGQTLAELADFRTLYVEGLAFPDAANALTTARQNNWPVTAVIGRNGNAVGTIKSLDIIYLADDVDRTSRALKFYVELPNEQILPTESRTEGQPRFMTWTYRPGQQVELRIPTEFIADQIVVPIDAVAIEGAETYVFERHDDSHGLHYDRVAVHVVRRDQKFAVLDPSGKIQEGDTIAARGAYQMSLALRNSAGAAVDPHAGHSH
jgi:hypothetical protein